MTFSSGTHLAQYEVLSKLGAGGMGEVYLAEDLRLHRKVALKVLPAEFASIRIVRRLTAELLTAGRNYGGSRSRHNVDTLT